MELTAEARRQGTYIIGTTGTGKTTLLQNIAYQDMANGDGLCVLDPHGDFIDDLLLRVPEQRRDDVILFDPGSPDYQQRPLGLNLFECDREDPKQVYRVTSTVIDTLRKLFSWSWGPRMEDLLRHSILTLMATPDTTLLELLLILISPEHRKRLLEPVTDPVLRQFWEVQFAAYDRRMRIEVVGSSLNKIGRFLANPLIRNVVCQPSNAFQMKEIMDKGKILLVNLSKGDLGEENSALLGAVLVNLVLVAALQRRNTPREQRRPFHLIVDEYQSFATESFPTLQSEARKYSIDVIVAHQYRDQLDRLNQGSTLNVVNFIVMRVSGRDGFELSSQFDNTPPPPEIRMEPVYKPADVDQATGEQWFAMRRNPTGSGARYHQVEQPRRHYTDVQAEMANRLSILPDYQAICRLRGNPGLSEHAIETHPPFGDEDETIVAYIRRQSLKRGRPVEEVEGEIRRVIGDRLEFDEIPEYEFPYLDEENT